MICPDCGFSHGMNITIHWTTGDEQYIDCPCKLIISPHQLSVHSFASLVDFTDIAGLSKRGNLIFGPPGTGKTHMMYALKNYFGYGLFTLFSRVATELLKFEPDMSPFYDTKFLDEFDSPDNNSRSGVLDRWLCNQVENHVIWITSNLTTEIIEKSYSPRLADRLKARSIKIPGESWRGTERQQNAFEQKRLWYNQWVEYREETIARDREKIAEKIQNGDTISTTELLSLDISTRNRYLRMQVKARKSL